MQKNDLEVNGDNHLSANDNRSWSLVYHCLIKYGCPVIFKYYRNNVSRQINGLLQFFVPRGHANSQIVKEFLDDELKRFYSEDSEGYGTDVQVLFFSGVQPYTERHEIEAIAQEAMDKLHKIVKNKIN